ncbi:homoserine dehydrogenase-domain-containing protein [Chytriomyces sp. MP71]|nr:homoserine dehydrogenase-domain-containing protein [Chytriomyces sp. MP71]
MSILNIALIGPGLVGSEFLSQLLAHQTRGAGPVLRVIAIASSSRVVSSGNGVDLTSYKALLASADVSPTDSVLESIGAVATAYLPCTVVDCTSSDAVAALYPAWLKAGVHVVTPNKKGFSGPMPLFNAIKEAQETGGKSGSRPIALHEATVGAGLPIISTLNDLVETGDEIVKIEGILSGTLSYIFNNYSVAGGASGHKFSDIVNVAKEKGYTEPDPRDDLNGMDVGRKVTILGRVAGIPLNLETLPIENIVPEPLRAVASAEEFMKRLPEYDDHFAALNAAAAAKGRVLRCVGVVDPREGSSVRLAEYDASHPFASLKGSDNIIAFTTRQFPNPLIVQGAGAGAAVTAFGMFSDILKIAKRVGYASSL